MAQRQENLLLASLPQEERERLDPFLEWRGLEFEEMLIEPNEPIKLVLFPYDLVTSTIQEMSDGSSIETGLMGIEGMIGIQLWLRMPSTSTRTFVQVPGYGHVMKAEDFVREVIGRPESRLYLLVARYTHAFLAMTSQTAACNRLHPLDQRLCRWLKLVHNRVRCDEFPMRQEFIAQMLGVQRPTVSTTANMLQRAGLITYTRGRMTILDAEGLVAGSCECYELMEEQMDRIYNAPWRELAHREEKKKS
ncbi:MAG TPA: Crp/Fnr family transcriptional regulator [Pyrinomonadaceae bacterium]|nr:Crp/Fnr family transcriptional regulator [Pyrinomonadaceae bacterium]